MIFNEAEQAALTPLPATGGNVRLPPYGLERIPIEKDVIITAVTGKVKDTESFMALSGSLSRDADRVLLAYATRIASFAVRERSHSHVRSSVIAIALAEAISDDRREVMMIASVAAHAAELIGLDPIHEFEDVANMIGGDVGTFLLVFSRRDQRHRAIEVMGYAEGEDQDGFRFVWAPRW